MGWLWSSSSRGHGLPESRDDAQTTRNSGWGLTEEQRRRVFGKSGALQETDQSRDSTADKELEAFINSLPSSDSPTPKQNKTSPSKSQPDAQPEPDTTHDRIRPDGTLNISPMAVYPRTMSCRQAFDQAFYCQSLGGKFNDIYRHGKLQSCSEQWGAFWFCMRTKSLPQKEKETQIRDYYAAREERKKKESGNSENVWEIREKPVERAFWKDPDVDFDGVAVQE